ncbi:MAG: spirocyclase AveC family protein [Sinimarinibacterium sp.]
MATVMGDAALPKSASGARASVAGDASVAIKWWAGVGALFLLFQLYVWGSWILSGDFTPTPAPANDETRRFWIKAFEYFCIVASSSTLYWFTIRPIIKYRRLTTDGIVIGVAPLLWFQDPGGLYVTQWWTYSSHFTNYGNWITHVPGAITPNANLVPEPVFAASSMYIWLVGIPFLIILGAMRAWKRRYPTSSPMTIFMVGMVCGFIYDFIAEFPACQVGLWAFTGAIQKWSIFGGHWYQYPIYEMFLWGGFAGASANVLYWTNDKGQTFVERGLEKVKAGPVVKGAMRYLAFLAIFQLLYLFVYNMPAQFFAMNGDPMPADTPAHLRPGVCGEGTQYACVGPGVPLNRAGPRVDGQPALIVTPEMRTTVIGAD